MRTALVLVAIATGTVNPGALTIPAADPQVRTSAAAITTAVQAFRPAYTAQITAQDAAPAPSQDAGRPAFADWLQGVRAEAISRGIRQEIVDQALSGLDEPLPVVIERDRAQAEIVLPLEHYIARRLTASLIRSGRQNFAEQKATLDGVAMKYGVPATIIAAIWGIESNFGRFTGVRPTVAALATLAWDPRRSVFFRGELFNALEILNRGDIALEQMRGSWAGAMGQPQFMPSSYLQYAEDYDGDGHRDIWSSPADIFASIANYVKGHGWVEGQTWGREVKVSPEAASHIASTVARRDGSCKAMRDMSVALPVAEWQRLGVRTMGGGALPKANLSASLVSGQSRRFLVYQNYDALLQYNCAHAYALSVAILGERLASNAPIVAEKSNAARPPRRASTRRARR